MIEQKPELWPPDGDRPRQWGAMFAPGGGSVLLRHFAVLEPGEELSEYPKTLLLTAQEWAETHADYGLNADGTPAG